MTADSLHGKAVWCTVSVVKADRVQVDATTNLVRLYGAPFLLERRIQGGATTNCVRREISISVAALNSPLW